MGEIFKKAIHSEFDKEIEMPDINLENINKALKELHGITDEMLNPLDSAFDKIVKDIRDRQDNAMAMEFTKCIGELLRKNGVVTKISEYRMENHAENHAENKIEMLYGVSIDELDFSEHDKVFEDKIARLESSYHRHRTKICDLENENHKLKQRIAELESRERKRPCLVSYVGVEEINGKEYVSMEKFATAMEELNAYFDKFFDN